ncbi:hypothetical protein [Lysobacter solisilvae (ex Woo and Kim 2020)]|uniref:Uncharacterized protein n=1 Tax=Agrilutibacter terrestris TaxID=2865112 RepID=A0A7H0G076_9GAMM|nr:hypothetical protein [Lysobacter terrestris]QNP41692.1 hypothetical protein H8B22_05655 [Lysobacter terrestris]
MGQLGHSVRMVMIAACMAGIGCAHAASPPAPAKAPAAAPRSEPTEAAQREMRQAALKVQQRLRAEQRAREEAQRAGTKNERCIGGQRMRRVANGWVDAGAC